MSQVESLSFLHKWDDCDLWKLLLRVKDPTTHQVAHLVEKEMPSIELILAKGGTAATDFTLHDSDHSFRVAQRMMEVIPSDVLPKLCAYEMGLLLLAAYLHDIGMTPKQGNVVLHYLYVLTGATSVRLEDRTLSLAAVEADQFQQWLDEQEVEPSPRGVPLTPELICLANQLVARYCRARHNEWSARWMRDRFVGFEDALYPGWLDDLVALCTSHHQGRRELMDNRFVPRPVGTHGHIVHLRYLACVLRVADVLEFDPERTPAVILRHRSISPASIIYWYKDKQISMLQEGTHITVSARPTSARIHRAVEDTLDQVEDELRLCRAISDESHFEVCPNRSELLPHRWDLDSLVRRDVKPHENSYEYINGAFRPNTEKLLELLAGTNLYRSAIVALRELTQNAFDAVRELMAYQRLELLDPSDQKASNRIADNHMVRLCLEVREDGTWLTCKDTGIGMTKRIIENHVLVCGTARRPDRLTLQRRCESSGFRLGLTDRFGIGVLSYFMLADRLVFFTRRASEPLDEDGVGWRFETEGVGDFGELRRDSSQSRGTLVELRMRPGVCDNAHAFYERLCTFFRETVLFTPCKTIIRTNLSDCTTVVLEKGWVRNPHYYDSAVIPPKLLDDNVHADDFFPEHIVCEHRSWVAGVNEARSALRWSIREGILPNELGQYRILLPYFDLTGGPSQEFMRVQEEHGTLIVEPIGNGHCIRTSDGILNLGWNGMQVTFLNKTDLYKDKNDPEWELHGKCDLFPLSHLLCCEVDFHSDRAGEIQVNRNGLVVHGDGTQCLNWLSRAAREFRTEFAHGKSASPYATTFSAESDTSLHIASPKWLQRSCDVGGDTMVWGECWFPLTVAPYSWAMGIPIPLKPRWMDREVCVQHDLAMVEMGRSSHTVLGGDGPPHRLVVWKPGAGRHIIMPLWISPESTGSAATERFWCRADFPPVWDTICGASSRAFYLGAQMLWNRNHPLLASTGIAELEWAGTQPIKMPLEFRDEILQDRAHAAAWVLQALQQEASGLWQAINERDASFLPGLWSLLFEDGVHGDKPTPVCFLLQFGESLGLRVVTPTERKVVELTDARELERYLPDPGKEWCVEAEAETPKPYVAV